jgi:hypothetical protein
MLAYTDAPWDIPTDPRPVLMFCPICSDEDAVLARALDADAKDIVPFRCSPCAIAQDGDASGK